MGTWTGTWEFRNVMHHQHGTRGITTVNAPNERDAKSRIKDEASRELFSTTGMQTYIDVVSIREGRH